MTPTSKRLCSSAWQDIHKHLARYFCVVHTVNNNGYFNCDYYCYYILFRPKIIIVTMYLLMETFDNQQCLFITKNLTNTNHIYGVWMWIYMLRLIWHTIIITIYIYTFIILLPIEVGNQSFCHARRLCVILFSQIILGWLTIIIDRDPKKKKKKKKNCYEIFDQLWVNDLCFKMMIRLVGINLHFVFNRLTRLKSTTWLTILRYSHISVYARIVIRLSNN